MKCPRCDHPRQPEERECSQCGIDFHYVEKKMARASGTAPPVPPESVAAPERPPEIEVHEVPAETPMVEAPAAKEPAAKEKASSPDATEGEPKPCPKCGFQNQAEAPECLRCGIIFNKYEAYLEKKRRAVEETNATTNGLLDPETVQLAAETNRQTPPAPVYAKTACPHCGQRFKIRNDQLGITTRCKKCSSIFKIESLPTITP
ncbi:MAG: hypothetical protein PVG19_00695 [Desulfobacterales bacterium]